MNKKLKTEAVDHLFQAILTLKSTEECYSFFEDVCTVNELLSFSQRYEVAKMLREKRTYLEIAESCVNKLSPEAWFAVSSGDSPAVPSCRLSSFASPAACVCGDCAAWPPHPDRMENTRHIARVILRYRFFSIM